MLGTQTELSSRPERSVVEGPAVQCFLREGTRVATLFSSTAADGRPLRDCVENHFGYFRAPNNAVPMRTWVAPSAMATVKSCDIPMDSSANDSRGCAAAS